MPDNTQGCSFMMGPVAGAVVSLQNTQMQYFNSLRAEMAQLGEQEIQVSSSTATQTANQITNSAQQQAYQCYAQAGQAFGSAGMSFMNLGVNTLSLPMGIGGDSRIQAESENLASDQGEQQNLLKACQETSPDAGGVVVEDPTLSPADRAAQEEQAKADALNAISTRIKAADPTLDDSAVATKAKEEYERTSTVRDAIRSGLNHPDAKSAREVSEMSKEDQKAYHEKAADRQSETKEALRSMSAKDRKKLEEDLKADIKLKQETINGKQTEIQNRRNLRQLIFTGLTQCIEGSMGMETAHLKNEQAKFDSAKEIWGFVAQTANSTLQAALQEMRSCTEEQSRITQGAAQTIQTIRG